MVADVMFHKPSLISLQVRNIDSSGPKCLIVTCFVILNLSNFPMCVTAESLGKSVVVLDNHVNINCQENHL